MGKLARVLALVPGTVTGFAFFVNQQLVQSGGIPESDLELALHALGVLLPAAVIIERDPNLRERKVWTKPAQVRWQREELVVDALGAGAHQVDRGTWQPIRRLPERLLKVASRPEQTAVSLGIWWMHTFDVEEPTTAVAPVA